MHHSRFSLHQAHCLAAQLNALDLLEPLLKDLLRRTLVGSCGARLLRHALLLLLVATFCWVGTCILAILLTGTESNERLVDVYVNSLSFWAGASAE